MKRFAFLLIAVFILVLAGCYGNGVEYIEAKKFKYTSRGEAILKAEVEVALTFRDRDDIDSVVKALKDIAKINGILDIAPPEYNLKLFHRDNSFDEYNLWLGDKRDTRGILQGGEDYYYINETSCNILRDLLK